MARTEKSNRSRRISVWNWMGTLILCSIPVVNIIALVLFIIFAKAQPKRSFAIAMLVLMVLFTVIACVLALIFPESLSRLADQLREATPASTVVPTV